MGDFVKAFVGGFISERVIYDFIDGDWEGHLVAYWWVYGWVC
jgi:hypothetical protein